MKQNKKRTSKLPFVNRRRIVVGALSLAIGGQLAFNGYMLMQLWHARVYPNSQIAEMILDSVDNASRPAVIDPVTKRVYIPEANLVLPYFPAGTQEVRYGYSEGYEAEPPSVQITSHQAVTQAAMKVRNAESAGQATKQMDRVFQEVPALQACSRGFEVILVPARAAVPAVTKGQTAKRLNDGRTALIRRDPGCPYQPEAMTPYINQLQSY